MSYIHHHRQDTPETLRARIADCDEVLARADANPPPAGSLADMCIGMTSAMRARAAASLQTIEALDRIAAAAGKHGPKDPVASEPYVPETFAVVIETIGHPDHDPGESYHVVATGLTVPQANRLWSETLRDIDEALPDCECEPSDVDGAIHCRCTVYPEQAPFICTDADAAVYASKAGKRGAS